MRLDAEVPHQAQLTGVTSQWICSVEMNTGRERQEGSLIQGRAAPRVVREGWVERAVASSFLFAELSSSPALLDHLVLQVLDVVLDPLISRAGTDITPLAGDEAVEQEGGGLQTKGSAAEKKAHPPSLPSPVWPLPSLLPLLAAARGPGSLQNP